MTRSTLDRWLLGAVGLVVLLVGAGVLNFQNTRQLREDAAWVDHSQEVMDALAETRFALREAEVVERTYLITGGDELPSEFQPSVDAVVRQVERLEGLTRDNPEQQQRAGGVAERVDELSRLWVAAMTTRRQEGLEAAGRIVDEGRSRSVMQELQDRLEAMDDAERGLMHARAARRGQTYRDALVTGLLSVAAAVLGVVAFMVLLRRHLAARGAAAAVIAEQAERLRTTLASIGDAVIATDTQGRVTTMNAVAEALTGWPADEAIGRPLVEVFRIVNEETRAPVDNPALRALRDGLIVGLANHTVLVARDGTERPIDDSAAPIRCREGTIVGCVLVFRDVTARRRHEQDLAEREQEFRTLAEALPQLCWMAYPDGHIYWYNRRWYDYTGTTREQMEGWGWQSVHDPDELPRVLAGWKRSIATGQPFDMTFPLRGADGVFRDFLTRVMPVTDEAGRVARWVGTNTDVSEARRTEAERQKFVTLVESSTDFIGMCDVDGMPFFVNRAGLEMIGLDSIEQAARTHVREFFFPEDQARIMDEFFPSVLAEGRGEIEIRFRHFRTGEARWMVYKVLTLSDAHGRAVAFATVSQDVTERRRMEDDLRRLAADLSEAGRRKDEFLATLAHELRNPLAPIRNALQVLGLTSDPAARDRARELMARQLDQMVRLVDDLLDVSRITRGKLELRRQRVELAAVVESAVETSRPAIDRMGHRLTVTVPDASIVVDADPMRLAQVFGNLLSNSAKYTDRGGSISLTVERRGGDVAVSVRDDGIGIGPDLLPHIFDMFSQGEHARDVSQPGLGIGLTLVRRLVDMHGGRIEVASAGRGRGAEFTVLLPTVEGAAVAAPVGEVRAEPAALLRVLVVDDNRDGADSLVMLLRVMGNETRMAYDGHEGLELARTFRPDAMLLDIGLPKLNGYEICRYVREQDWGHDVVLVAVTGWGQEEDRRRSREAGFDHHLVKPVDPEDLRRVLSGVAERRRAGVSTP